MGNSIEENKSFLNKVSLGTWVKITGSIIVVIGTIFVALHQINSNTRGLQGFDNVKTEVLGMKHAQQAYIKRQNKMEEKVDGLVVEMAKHSHSHLEKQVEKQGQALDKINDKMFKIHGDIKEIRKAVVK